MVLSVEIFDHESNEFLSIRVAVLDEFFEMTPEVLWCRFR